METPNPVSQKIRILLKTNTKKGFLEILATENYEHEKYEHVQHSILDTVDQSVALLRCYESSGCSDSGLQLFCIAGSGISHLPLHNTP